MGQEKERDVGRLMSEADLDALAEKVADRLAARTKEALNIDEACEYIGMKKTWMYQATRNGVIPHYKPGGKVLYFKRADLDAWMLSGRVSTKEEIEMAAVGYCLRNPMKRGGRRAAR